MQTYTVTLVGKTPLIMHNNHTVNVLNRYAKAMKVVTAKRKKTDADHELLSRIEWEAGLYIRNGVIGVPSKCIEACLREGAKLTRNGTAVSRAVMLEEIFCPLRYTGPKLNGEWVDGDIPNPILDRLFVPELVDMTIMRIKSNSVTRTRPMFEGWSLDCTFNYVEDLLDFGTLEQCLRDAGKRIGLMDSRRYGFGRFEVAAR